MSLIFVDCEAWGNSPVTGQLTEFGAVDRDTLDSFHGVIVNSEPDPDNPAIPMAKYPDDPFAEARAFRAFEKWLNLLPKPYVFVSDNPAFDWQWINCGFWKHCGHNPFGHSARRIGDFYAGLNNNFWQTQKWKRLRITKHDHNPVHDALGNVEAFNRLLKGER